MSDGHECPTCGQWVEPELTPEQRERMLANFRAYTGTVRPMTESGARVAEWLEGARRWADRFPSRRDSDEPAATSVDHVSVV